MKPDSDPSFVVGIGASAGGLEALERFFDHVPIDTGMAFVVVQHLSPDFKSLMDELLARHTELPIRLVEDGMPIEANHIYLIPPRKEMIVSGGKLLLSERDLDREPPKPIDTFFVSLARDYGPRAVAIVLSGGGTDGSRGIRDIRDAGGLVFVQDKSAQFDGMPRSAHGAGVEHVVLSPEDMPKALLDHANLSEPVALPQPPAGLDVIYALLHSEFGIDFTQYKPSTVTRRIERRIMLARASSLEDYVRRLEVERDELDVLYRDLLVGVTRFFRNEKAFESLEKLVIPELFRRTNDGDPLRIWIAGCATGEEVYSLAILFAEASAMYGNRPLKIFATDVHPGSLETASRGIYSDEAVRTVSPERLERWFVQRPGGYQVVPELRQSIVFAPHDVIKDAPFTRLDLITCRNLLIYLRPAAQQKVLSLFHFALKRGGIVFLGPSETPGAMGTAYDPIDRHWRIYRKRTDIRPHPVTWRATSPKPIAIYGRSAVAQLLQTYDSLLEELVPPSLLVSEQGELVHVFDGASRFLRLRDGRPGLDVLDVVREDLRLLLAGGIRRTLKDKTRIVFKQVKVEEEGTFNVSVRYVRARGGGNAHVLISFESTEAITLEEPETEINMQQARSAHVAAMETELARTKENLQAAIEELETSNEELQTSNEELLASNEELQSTNEELQSVNEELYTVNAEYQRKIAELTELTNDMDNLLSSVDVGTIFLDVSLRIRKFTPQIAKLFNLLPQDIGRSLETFTNDIVHPNLIEDLRSVVSKGEKIERDVKDRQGRVFFLRILPYRAGGDIAGVVLTLIDASGLRAAEDALFHERHLLESLMTSVPDAIYFKDAHGRFIRANGALAARFGKPDARSLVGRTMAEMLPPDEAAAWQAKDDRVIQTGKFDHYQLEKHLDADGRARWSMATRLPLFDRENKVVGVIGVLSDITELKEAEAKIQEAVRRRDEFLAMLSHELRNPLGAIVSATALLKRSSDEPQRRQRPIHIVERQSQQMAHLLDDLLDASRVTQNKIELRRSTVDMCAIARDAADAVRGMMEEAGVSFDAEIEEGPLWVDGDPARLQQIQVNLLSNAAKYTPRGGHARLEVVRENGHALVRVRDDGAGIPNEMLESVFDLFVQSKRTLDRSKGGLGLGLTIVRSLVVRHGGTVGVRSDGEGKGSEFSVRIPLTSSVAVEATPYVPRARPVFGRGARVAVVEDNADSRELLLELLQENGFECSAAHDGPSGIALITQMKPDVAIVDIGLPNLDGFDLARSVRRTPANTYLIAMTGYGQPQDRARAVEAGFDEHLVKPVRPADLIRILGAS